MKRDLSIINYVGIALALRQEHGRGRAAVGDADALAPARLGTAERVDEAAMVGPGRGGGGRLRVRRRANRRI